MSEDYGDDYGDIAWAKARRLLRLVIDDMNEELDRLKSTMADQDEDGDA